MLTIIVIAIVAPGLAFGGGIRGVDPPRPIQGKKQLVLSAPVGNGFYAHLFHSPSTTGGRCEFIGTDRHRVPAGAAARGAGGCSVTGSATDPTTKSHPLNLGLEVERRPREGTPKNWVPPVVTGSVYPGLHATHVEIRWRGGSHPLTVKGNYFLGGTPKLYMPPFREFPFFVVAYDAKGRELARAKLESPSLLLLRGGWKEYAQEYHEWKKAHHR